MSCPWPVCSWWAPTKTLFFSVSKMPRYYFIGTSRLASGWCTFGQVLTTAWLFSLSYQLWSTTPVHMTSRHCLFIILRSQNSGWVEAGNILFFYFGFEAKLSMWIFFLGWFCAKRTHTHCPSRSREPLCCHAHLWLQTCSASLQEGHSNWWTGRWSWRRVCLNFCTHSGNWLVFI